MQADKQANLSPAFAVMAKVVYCLFVANSACDETGVVDVAASSNWLDCDRVDCVNVPSNLASSRTGGSQTMTGS